MYLMQQGLKTREDSLKCLKEVETLYASNKDAQIFNSLVTLYGGLGMDDKQLSLIGERIAVEPNNANIWAMKGQNEMNAGKWDDAIASLKKSVEIDDKQAIVFTYLGYSMNSKAAKLFWSSLQDIWRRHALWILTVRKLIGAIRYISAIIVFMVRMTVVPKRWRLWLSNNLFVLCDYSFAEDKLEL